MKVYSISYAQTEIKLEQTANELSKVDTVPD